LDFCSLRKEKELEDTGLQLDWKPFRDLIEATYFPAHRAKVSGNFRAHIDLLLQAVDLAKKYFPKGSATEILAEYRPSFFLHGGNLHSAVGYMVRFLPTNTEEVDALIPEFVSVFEWLQHTSNWEYLWFSLFSRLASLSFSISLSLSSYFDENSNSIAKHRIGKVDFNPYLPALFTSILASFDLPLGSIKLPASQHSDIPQKSAIFLKSLPDKHKTIGKFLAYTVHDNSNTMVELEKLFQLIEPFFHPSNGGKWSPHLAKFLLGVTDQFVERMHDG